MPRLPDYRYKLENVVEQNIRRVFKDLAPDLNIEIAHDIYDTIFTYFTIFVLRHDIIFHTPCSANVLTFIS